jgi:hypothetical protein
MFVKVFGQMLSHPQAYLANALAVSTLGHVIKAAEKTPDLNSWAIVMFLVLNCTKVLHTNSTQPTRKEINVNPGPRVKHYNRDPGILVFIAKSVGKKSNNLGLFNLLNVLKKLCLNSYQKPIITSYEHYFILMKLRDKAMPK